MIPPPFFLFLLCSLRLSNCYIHSRVEQPEDNGAWTQIWELRRYFVCMHLIGAKIIPIICMCITYICGSDCHDHRVCDRKRKMKK
ncbi:hypothetical protein F4678DRAFT_389739 [Xylaria arbuscula]|nr:hypothetical protein F4678DRAFT_389739 [Xylaria arbuscula]